MQKKDQLFTVRGKGPFPFEMLYLGKCYPASADDVDEILCTCAPDEPKDEPHELTRASREEQDLRRWIETGWVLVEKSPPSSA